MQRPKRIVMTLAVAAGMSMFSLANAQTVEHAPATIQASPAIVQASDCSSCNGGNFNYPGNCGGAYGGHRFGGRFAEARHDIHYQIDQMKQQSEKVRARNDAWPKPFACMDRQAYHNIWNGFYESGFIAHCTLIDDHFDNETGELNRYGESVVQGLMKNSPNHRREVFIYDGRSDLDFETKRRSVEDLVNRWYGRDSIQVSATNRWPMQGSGLRSEATNRLFAETTPPPVITVPTGSGSTSQSQSGN